MRTIGLAAAGRFSPPGSLVAGFESLQTLTELNDVVSRTPNDRNSSSELEALRSRVAELEQQLLQSQKLSSVGELASSLTHEFNNILTTVINYAKLGMRHQDQTQRDKAFDKILSAGQRAAKLTTGLLSYVRARDTRREPNSLVRLVKDMLVLVDKDLHVHRIHLELKIDGDPYASVNPGEVQQVLLNLLVNARQAMQPGGTLTVTVAEEPQQGWAEISIQDTGVGIPADKLPNIFTRFFTTKTADQQGQGGTGLGLALCKNIMDAHGGRIRVESAVGRGTRFTLKFPSVKRPDLSAACGLSPENLQSRDAKPAETTPR